MPDASDDIERWLTTVEFGCAQIRVALATMRVGGARIIQPVVHDGSSGVSAQHDEPPSRCVV